MEMVIILYSTVGSLSKGVFERRTATGNETFSLFTRLGATTFVILSVSTLIQTIYLKIRSHPMPKNEKRPLPVAVRPSKTPLLKLPTVTMYRAGVFKTNRIIVNDWISLCLRKIIYQLNYSESSTGNLHHCDSITEGYQYSMSKERAFESLVSQSYFFIYSDNRMYWCISAYEITAVTEQRERRRQLLS